MIVSLYECVEYDEYTFSTKVKIYAIKIFGIFFGIIFCLIGMSPAEEMMKHFKQKIMKKRETVAPLGETIFIDVTKEATDIIKLREKE